jgi:hypothetical protein
MKLDMYIRQDIDNDETWNSNNIIPRNEIICLDADEIGCYISSNATCFPFPENLFEKFKKYQQSKEVSIEDCRQTFRALAPLSFYRRMNFKLDEIPG